MLHLDYATFQHEFKQERPYLDKKRRSIIVPPYLMKWVQQIRMWGFLSCDSLPYKYIATSPFEESGVYISGTQSGKIHT